MAQLGNFDATQVAPATRPPALPTGWYNVMITDSEMKLTKDQQGQFLYLGMKVQDGPYAGRMLYDRLNLVNKNPVAVEIAQGALSAICHATGVMQVQDSQQLHGRPFQARAVKTEADGQYDEGNDIKGYAALGTHPTAQANGGAPAPAGPPAPAGYAPPPAPAGYTPPAMAAAPTPPAPTPPAPAPPAPPAPAPAPAGNPAYTPPPMPTAPPSPQAPPAPPAPAPAGADTTPPWLRQQ